MGKVDKSYQWVVTGYLMLQQMHIAAYENTIFLKNHTGNIFVNLLLIQIPFQNFAFSSFWAQSIWQNTIST